MKLIFLIGFLSICNYLIAQNSHETKDIQASQQLLSCTIKIVGIKDSVINGKRFRIQSIGTGFFFEFVSGQDTIVSIVTAAHLVRGCRNGILKFNSGKNNHNSNYGDIISINLSNFEKLWVLHPKEDLAILPVYPIAVDAYENVKKLLGFRSFGKKYLPSSSELDSFSAIQPVIMIGYPKGFSDTINNIPIVRIGNTATPVFFNYNNRPEFLVDIPTYTGSSGSPVLIFSEGGYTYNGNYIMGSRIVLLGIAIESQDYVARGTTVSNDPNKRMETRTMLPFNITIALKSSLLLDFLPILDILKKDPRYYKLLKDNIHSSSLQ